MPETFAADTEYAVPAVVAYEALAIVPTMFAAGIFVKPAPEPINLPEVVMLPSTFTYTKLPTACRLEYNTFALSVDPTNAPALTFDAAIPVNKDPLPIK